MSEEDHDSFELEVEKDKEHGEVEVEEEIRISSDGSSPNIEEKTIKVSTIHNQFELFDKMIDSLPEKKKNEEEIPSNNSPNKKQEHISQVNIQKEDEKEEFEENKGPKKIEESIIGQIQKEWILKEAELQRIGGTYDFFAYQIGKYFRHLASRRGVLQDIQASIDRNKAAKAQTIIMLKQYFKDYSQVCGQFHEKSYDFVVPQRQQSDNKIINMRVEMKQGFQRLLNLRRTTGNDMSRLDKYMKATTLNKIGKAIEVYWGAMGSFQAKCTSKRQIFEDKQKKIVKRVEKVTKLYSKGRVGSDIEEDVFIQMTKFVKEEKELRLSIFDWSREVVGLRRSVMNADYGLMTELQGILAEYKNYNSTVYQLKKKKYNFSDRLKDNIQKQYQYDKLLTPLDNDYVLSISNFKNKGSRTLLKHEDYEQFLGQQYFSQVIGETSQFLKGTIIKSFPLKDQDEELIRTASGNIVLYAKKTFDIKNKMKTVNTQAVFDGYGWVILKQIQKGIIFDSENVQKVQFKDDNRAEQLIMYLSGSFGSEQI